MNEQYSVGDKVDIICDSGHGEDGTDIVSSITWAFEMDTGEKRFLVVLEGGGVFYADTGRAFVPLLAYSIKRRSR